MDKINKIPRDEFFLLVDLMVAAHGRDYCEARGGTLNRDRELATLENAACAYVFWKDIAENVNPDFNDRVKRILDEVTHGQSE